MATRVAVDKTLLAEAHRISGCATKADTVADALKEYINRRKQSAILDLFGRVSYMRRYDYRRQRLQ